MLITGIPRGRTNVKKLSRPEALKLSKETLTNLTLQAATGGDDLSAGATACNCLKPERVQ
jgi:hypothetical protein